MPLIKISDNVATDEDEPEILFNAHQHAREHLTVEMALYLLQPVHRQLRHRLADHATSSTAARSGSCPTINPDGGEYDIATGSYRSWRKNRQPNSGSSNVGTDLNRNWGYQWGCCGGSSGSTGSRRPTAARRRSPRRRPSGCATSSTAGVVGGVQQIKANIDFHTYSRAGALAVRLHHRQHRRRT